jgi:hypothetical protein
MMALSGVRSSWLMLAMNSDFTLLASSASTRAERSATRARCRSIASPRSEAYSFINEGFFWFVKGPLNIAKLLVLTGAERKSADNNQRLTAVCSWNEQRV